MDMIIEMSKHTGEKKVMSIEEGVQRLAELGAPRDKDDHGKLSTSVYEVLLEGKWYERERSAFKLRRSNES